MKFVRPCCEEKSAKKKYSTSNLNDHKDPNKEKLQEIFWLINLNLLCNHLVAEFC